MSLTHSPATSSNPTTVTNTPASTNLTQKRKSDTVDLQDEEDEDLLEAIRLSQTSSQPMKVEEKVQSISAEPDKGPEIAEMVMKLPDGSRLQRRFHKNATIGV